MALQPWYRVTTPREDLREGKPLDAAEFAVHLDQVRDGRATSVYQLPEQFFQRTYLTKNLTDLAAEVVRRLSGENTATSAVFNLATQFGGGKTHALTLLYHLANQGPASAAWPGVTKILQQAGVSQIPQAAVAVFVGTEFDALSGRGVSDGTPLRRTPWGEIAYQLGGVTAFQVVAEHDQQLIAPAGDVIRRFLPIDRPCLILLDELLNYVNRSRRTGAAGQLHSFLQNLSEEARARDNLALAVSLPASELEMTAEDQADYDRFARLLNRLGKAVVMSAEAETSEIIRRRLFEWDEKAVSQEGKILLHRDAIAVCNEHAAWVTEHRQQLPQSFPVDHARDAFVATYPFHPSLLSVFERKWQELPRFQRTRGVLRLLALWVSRAYAEGYKGAHRDPLISLGSAPLDDPMFRSALFEQVGEPRLEGAVTTDIVGKRDAHALRLDAESVDTIRRSRLHRKVATAIFFESNGGQTRAEATVPEIRLAVAEPGLDLGNVETALEALGSACYYLTAERNRYRFSLLPNLNSILADRRGNIPTLRIEERLRAEIQRVFDQGKGAEKVYFPEKSGQVPDRPALTLVMLAPEHSMQDKERTLQLVESMTREHGSSNRAYKSALVWVVADSETALQDEVKKLLAWEDIDSEKEELRLDDTQKRQISENVAKARRDLREVIWRVYKNVILLGKDNQLKLVDLGLVHSSAASSLIDLVLSRLQQDGDVVESLSPNFLLRNWPPAFTEWSVKAVRDACFASPQFPRLRNPDAIRETIARGVSNGLLAYTGKGPTGEYQPFFFETSLNATEVEISEDTFILTAEEARKRTEPPTLASITVTPSQARLRPGQQQAFIVMGQDQHQGEFPVDEANWSATGGVIDEQGVFQAGQDNGNFVVTARVGTLQGFANVSVSAQTSDTPPLSPLRVQPTGIRALSWSGEVPPQKWMNFYTRVLSRFATDKGLKLVVNVEVSPDGGVPEHRIEETRLALRELGLNDDVNAN